MWVFAFRSLFVEEAREGGNGVRVSLRGAGIGGIIIVFSPLFSSAGHKEAEFKMKP